MKFFKYIAVGVAAVSLSTACTDDLNQEPTNPTTKLELTSVDEWNAYFGSVYETMVYDFGVTLEDGGAGVWMRCQWNLQEITADECVISKKWNDPGYDALNFCTWLTDNPWIEAAYTRQCYTARYASEFIRQTDKIYSLTVDTPEEQARLDQLKAMLPAMKDECRVLRAYAYYYMIDMFGRGPWITDNSLIGSIPPTYNRTQLFDAVVAELVDVIENGNLVPAAQQVYGRLSKEAARMLLAKLYLNSEVYTGVARYAECAEQCKIIRQTIDVLEPEYKYLFCGDNDRLVACNQNPTGEIIWALPQQAGVMESWGNTTYLTAGAYIESAPAEVLTSLGANGCWSGLRMRGELSRNLRENGGTRNLVFAGQYNIDLLDLEGYDETSCGYMCTKFVYTNHDDYYNEAGYVPTSQVCNTDFPVFRTADLYLMLSECQYRGVAGADPGYELFNKVRARAGMNEIGAGEMTAQVLVDERQSELYFEGHRRSDLIRFGLYTGGNYKWSWKGGIYEGASIPDYRSVYAIPYQYTATVGQNPGY